jgi:mannose-6-phosphate isomerase class I
VVSRPEPVPGGTRERLVRCPYFSLERLRLDGSAGVSVGCPEAARFTILIGLEGSVLVRYGPGASQLRFGETLLLPAALGPCALVPRDGGTAVVLTCTVP